MAFPILFFTVLAYPLFDHSQILRHYHLLLCISTDLQILFQSTLFVPYFALSLSIVSTFACIVFYPRDRVSQAYQQGLTRLVIELFAKPD